MQIKIEVPDDIPLEIIRDALVHIVNELNQHEEIKEQLWIDPKACLEALEKMKQGDSSSTQSF